jgi:hypothetical protein
MSKIPDRTLTDGEMALAYSGPAVAVNRFFLIAGPHGVRLALAEEAADKKSTRFCAAVVLSPEDAMSLARLLAKAATARNPETHILQ